MTARLSVLETQFGEMRSDISKEISNMKTEILSEIRTESIASALPTPQAGAINMGNHIFDCLREERIREKRKLNLCIHNFPESSNAEIDKNELINLLATQMNLSDVTLGRELLSLRRLGAPRETPRSIIVTFKESPMRREILQNAYKLKNYLTPLGRKVIILPDMTPKQQEENKKVNTELRRRREEGENVSIKHGKIVNNVGNRRPRAD